MDRVKWKYYSTLAIFFLMAAMASGQEEYPLSRQDSALLETYNQKYESFLAGNYPKEASRYLNKLAMLYWEHNHFLSALEHYGHSLELNQKVGNENGVAMIHSNLAMINADLGRYEEALGHFRKTLTARKVKGEKVGTISALINMSVVLNNMARYDESIKALEEALDLAREMNAPDQMKSCYGMLAETHEKAGNPEQSLYYFDYYRTFHEKVQDDKIREKQQQLQNERLQRELAEAQKRNQELENLQKERVINRQMQQIETLGEDVHQLADSLTKRELALKYQEQLRENEKQEFERVRERQVANRNYLLATVGFILVVAVLLYLGYRQKRKSADELKKQNTRIRSQREQIQMQAQILQKSNDKLQRLSEFKEGLMSMIVHDMKVPLNTMLTHAREQQHKSLQRAAGEMERMVMNILDVRKFEQDRFEVAAQWTSLASIVSPALEQTAALFDEKSVPVAEDIPPDTEVYCDQAALVRVLINLLSNAAKHTPLNGTATLRADWDDDGQNLQLAVHNTGPAIPPHMQERIFEQFQQVEARDTGRLRSTGLGLSYCKLAVEAHESKIGVDSSPEGGTAFFFTLKARKSGSTGTPIQTTVHAGPATKDEPPPEVAHLREKLQDVEFYEVSVIRRVLAEIDDNMPQAAQHWKEELQRAVFAGNQERYDALTQSGQKTHQP